ncbi:hypothetical protein [Glaciimonas sp. PCH181]|nr:hypothetical protein [Glaciimonas sp. PCH181]
MQLYLFALWIDLYARYHGGKFLVLGDEILDDKKGSFSTPSLSF